MVMQIEERPLDTLKPYEQNPRVNDHAVDAVAASIREFGFRVPIIVDGEDVIVAGHTRWKAARKLGLESVPVHVARDLSQEQIRALRIADNQTASLSDWDAQLLPIELSALQDSDYDLSILGFDADTLANWLLGGKDVTEGMTDPDAIPEPPDEAISKRGEVYILGGHRLMCGSATEPEDMIRLMREERADLLLTDPPYNVAYVGKTRDALTIQNDAKDDASFLEFLTAAFGLADSVMKPGAAFYIWHADSEGFNFRSAARTAGWRVRQCLVWNKNSMVLGRQDYQWKHEPCLYGWKDGGAHQWHGDRKQTTVLDCDRPNRSAEHPTMKPIQLFVRQIRNSTAREGIVLDPFAGSGTTAIAAEQLGRHARLMELDPIYCDVIRKRYAEFKCGEGCDWAALTAAQPTTEPTE